MITGKDVYEVFAAIVPLYAVMIFAYGSIRWWKIFTPESMLQHKPFVALLAIPLLSFHFISSNNPYAINYKFLIADSLQKVVILVALFLWQAFSKGGNLEWMIIIFSLSTLPNTLVIGITLLKDMYCDFSATSSDCHFAERDVVHSYTLHVRVSRRQALNLRRVPGDCSFDHVVQSCL
ncbi:unnamed protein product [Prunus armeniaca]|uniref:Auxin efflux carrier component n=1 Tax=Prunus armeniaca TaxID=36596 RepID=A0A6J5TFS7_PRUAR|nr:unnamed protein product [Prunus armeniaca]